jgi:SAM-dependent methyltransferase
MENIFTEIYNTNKWGCQETVSGPCSSQERTQELRVGFQSALHDLEIQSIVDCGCGDWNWMRSVNLTGIQYLGLEIVQPLVETLQKQFSAPTVKFQHLDIFQQPLETADLWLARDVLCFYTLKEIKKFFQLFIESQSKFLGISSIDTEQEFNGQLTGFWKQLNFFSEPFAMPEPMLEIADGKQWFRAKKILIYNRQQIIEWFMVRASKLVIDSEKQVSGKQDRNAHLVSNVPLSEVTLHVRKA